MNVEGIMLCHVCGVCGRGGSDVCGCGSAGVCGCGVLVCVDVECWCV